MLSDRCKCTLAAGSLITVTRSCGICTRFPFTLSRAPEGSAARQTMKGTCCFIFSFRFIVAHCIQKRKVLFVCSAEFFGLPGRPYSRRCKISHKRFLSSGLAACSFIPAVLAGCTSLAKALAVMATMGTCAASALGKERMAAGRVFVFCRFTTLNRLQLAWQCGKLIWI